MGSSARRGGRQAQPSDNLPANIIVPSPCDDFDAASYHGRGKMRGTTPSLPSLRNGCS